MTAVPAGTTWQTFNDIKEIPTSTGGKFYMFRQIPGMLMCRMDQRFDHLIEPEIEALKAGEEVQLACIVDPTKPDLEKNWRISLKYYEARWAEYNNEIVVTKRLPLEQAARQPEEKTTTKITFSASVEDHAFMANLHKRTKQTDKSLRTFEDFNIYMYSTMVRILRMQNPDLWGLPAPSDMPF